MRTLLASIALGWALFAHPTAQAQDAIGDLSKPFSDYTLGDLFPPTVDERAVDVGQTFVTWGKDHRAAIEQRVAAVEGAISVKKAELKALKEKEKAAKKSKDLATAGAVGGTIDAESVVVSGLEALAEVTASQLDFADSMKAYGEAIQEWYKTSQTFRSHSDVKFERGSGGLGPEGKKDMEAATQATVALSKAQDDMALAMKKAMAARVKFIKALQKGGIVAP